MKNVNLKFNEGLGEYSHLVETLIRRDFPIVKASSAEDQVSDILSEFISTKQNRIGSIPEPETLVALKSNIRYWVQRSAPIPLLSVGAAVKLPPGEGVIDLAELIALKVLQCLHDRVKQIYEPGITVRHRLDDLTERSISEGTPNLDPAIIDYVIGFTKLIEILDMDSWLTPVPESSQVSAFAWLNSVDYLRPVFQAYLEASTGVKEECHSELHTFKRLEQLGWKGVVPFAQRKWWLDRYETNYPDRTFEEYQKMMATYLANTLTRSQMNARGTLPNWDGKHIELSWAPRLPYTPIGSARIHYRSIPRSEGGGNNIPFWAAKAVIHIDVDKPEDTMGYGLSSKVLLSNWWEKNPKVQSGTIELIGSRDSVTLGASYLLETHTSPQGQNKMLGDYPVVTEIGS